MSPVRIKTGFARKPFITLLIPIVPSIEYRSRKSKLDGGRNDFCFIIVEISYLCVFDIAISRFETKLLFLKRN